MDTIPIFKLCHARRLIADSVFAPGPDTLAAMGAVDKLITDFCTRKRVNEQEVWERYQVYAAKNKI